MPALKIHSAEFKASCGTVEQFLKPTIPEVAIVGRSNVGKSSAINCLVNHKGLAKVGKTPGKTQTINFFHVQTNGSPFMLVDLPGYGFAKVPDRVQQQWAPLIEAFFQSRKNLRGVIMLVDSRRVQDSDRDMLVWVSQLQLPIMLVATKADKIPRGKRQGAIRELQEGLGVDHEPTFLSAYTGEGKQQVLGQLQDLLKS
ncbi:MAG: ribosome biogenesis GTP-binding protein YihA/YsxC [Nitrospirota bacterium]|nr:ribosome biogenesis GTP-binding protein YihA/YsxC [Nitrospirota bacterium]MDH5587866.1 ribosome biogenesis GTP-binding protein YihA/YsxC [Nitrospirota bacterium]MDH5775342.1 ribosome biogenesis GTP-binding protein YihA/YsxC [Nitrospirota bacterium]